MTYEPTKDGAEMLAEIQAAVDKCDQLSASLDRLDEEAAAAQAAVDGATQKRAQLLADRAMCTESAEAKAFNVPLKRVAEAASEATLELEAVQVARQTLEDRLLAAEEELRSLSDFNVPMMLGQYAEAACDQIASEITAVVRQLLPVLTKMAALQAATNSTELGLTLNEIVITLPGQRIPVLTGNRSFLDGQLNIREAWRAVPELVELHDAASAGRLLAAKVRGYVPRKSRKVMAKPYERRGYSKDGELTRAAVASAPQTPAQAPATTNQQRDLQQQNTLRTGALRPAEIRDGNVMAGVANKFAPSFARD